MALALFDLDETLIAGIPPASGWSTWWPRSWRPPA